MSLDVLVLTDLHYPLQPSANERRHGNWARLFYRKALRKLQHENITPGLVVLLGDLLDDAEAPGAEEHLCLLAEEILRDGIPVLAVPGNHDNTRRVAEIFNSAPGLHVVGGYGFVIFHDTPGEPYTFLRSGDDLALPEKIARESPGLPLIALQHAPLCEKIRGNLRLKNNVEALASYERAGVVLSLSGHAHEGHEPVQYGPTRCITLPAFCESPFPFLHLRLDGGGAATTFHELRLPDGVAFSDTHCHTSFAQCAGGVNVVDNWRLSKLLGVDVLALTEHAFQLYFPSPFSWSFKWQEDPAFAEGVWQTPNRGRMAAYKNFIRTQRRENLLLGLEVDLYDNGKLLLHPDDMDGWDILVGAIHRVQGAAKGEVLPARFEALFMRDLRALLGHPIDILAHPFRIFKAYGVPYPAHLYDEIARLLADAQVAAEINFHDTPPELDFFKVCLRRGVKLSLATDGHGLQMVGDLHPHVRFLESLGIGRKDFREVLLDPLGLARDRQVGRSRII